VLKGGFFFSRPLAKQTHPASSEARVGAGLLRRGHKRSVVAYKDGLLPPVASLEERWLLVFFFLVM